ncbi:UPF0223 family protein [Chryseomicrobium sp. FSL W7-1435]|uniref:UPF0223 family protein n=1 Tax=Chryseomicrobium sp. FSL W7-1435 TaxID=2921704 RepID=UPI00315A1A12
MANEYSYPLSFDWTTEEMVAVVEFYQAIEEAYEKGITRDKVMTHYKKFKEVVRSIAEEKTSFREFEEASGYSAYPVVKAAKEGQERIRLTKKTK